jgi:hypothetical protein
MNCEGGGFGSSRMLPSQLLKESAYYFTVRSIILSEQRKIQTYQEKKRNK